MIGRQKPPVAVKICNLIDDSQEPSDQQLNRLMHLVGEDARSSVAAVSNTIRLRRQQSIAEGRKRTAVAI